jgi:hypothetical protein
MVPCEPPSAARASQSWRLTVPIDKNDATFNQVYAAQLDALTDVREWVNWSDELPRQPRLEVPVDVQALVVPEGASIEHADIAVTTLARVARRAHNDEGEEEEPRSAPPFTDADPRPPGVYLHWTMPDGLTQGRVTGDADATGSMDMRSLPDRWLVVRVEQGDPHPFRAWMIESEKGLAVPLEEWPTGDLSDAETPEMPSSGLTATAGGDTAWAVVVDNVTRRFAFHDPLVDRAGSDPLTYLVVGWYSDPELDPLNGATGYHTLHEVLDELGWEAPELEERYREWLRSRDRFTQKTGAKTPDATAGVDVVRAGAEMKVPLVIGDKAIEVGEATRAGDVPWYPQQCVFHGRIHGVRSDGGGHDRKPAASRVKIGVGPTGAESLATLLAASADGDPEIAERLQAAFQYGLMDSFEDPDGLPFIEEEMHRRTFETSPGGFTRERVRRSDPLAPFRGATRPTKVSTGRPGVSEVSVNKGLVIAFGTKASTTEQYYAQKTATQQAQTQALAAKGVGEEEFEEVERSHPRWHHPQDPVVTLEGLNRSLRSGYDGRFTEEDRLICRLSGSEQPGYDNLVDGGELLQRSLRHGGIPPEADALLREAVARDPGGVDVNSRRIAEQKHLPSERVSARLRAETTLDQWLGATEVDVAAIAYRSLAPGTAHSPVGVTYWTQPWVPLYLEWKLKLALDPPQEWALGEGDFIAPQELAAPGNEISGRSLLNSAAAKAFADKASAFLAAEAAAGEPDEGIVDADTEELLAELVTEARRVDRLNAALEGLNEFLLGFDTNQAIGPHRDDIVDEDGDEPEPAPSRPPTLVRAGHAVLTAMRVVDAFGRYLDLPLDIGVRVADQFRSLLESSEGVVFEQPPRITARSRLWFRFVDTQERTKDALLDQQGERDRSPVAAWLLPDHVDRALELFDSVGDPLGQLRHESLGGGVVWEGAPGRPGSVGEAPSVDDLGDHASAFVRALVARDVAEREGLSVASDDHTTEERESPLSALLRVVDTTLWTVDPFGRTGGEHISMLTGHAIAMVRARLTLEVYSDVGDFVDLDETVREEREEAFRALSEHTFQVRLGALTKAEDGLLGYFVGDDYGRFYPVHDQVRLEGSPGPGGGHLGPVEAPVSDDSVEITSPYIVRDPTVDIHPGQTIFVTLLLMPGGKVHATSGILPRKGISLPRDWVAEALERICPSFRLGPVFVDPATVRMPRPSALPKEQVWTRRDTPVSWRDDPILAATQDALLPEISAVSQEGYIRVVIQEEE